LEALKLKPKNTKNLENIIKIDKPTKQIWVIYDPGKRLREMSKKLNPVFIDAPVRSHPTTK